MNYDPSQVGLPYVRVTQLKVDWPDSLGDLQPTALIEQSLAVKLADGSIRTLDKLPSIGVKLDFTQGDEPIPLVDPETAQPLGIDTSLNQIFVQVLAVIRKYQIETQG